MKSKILFMFALLIALAAITACSKQSAQKQDPATDGQTAEEQQTPNTDNTAGGTQAEKPATTETGKPRVEQPASKPATGDKPAVVKNEPKIPEPVVVSLPESTVIAIELVDSIDTDVHVTGTEYRARILEPVVYGGETVFEKAPQLSACSTKLSNQDA